MKRKNREIDRDVGREIEKNDKGLEYAGVMKKEVKGKNKGKSNKVTGMGRKLENEEN